MAETLENTMFENEEVVAGDYPGIELIEEYSDLLPPDYSWEIHGNLIACLQFPNGNILKKQFQEFVVERQDQARYTENLTIQSEKEIEAWENEKRDMEKQRKEQEATLQEMSIVAEDSDSDETDEVPALLVDNLDGEVAGDSDLDGTDEDDETEKYLKTLPTVRYKRAIWARGIVLDYQIVGDDGRIIYLPTEIRCDVEPNLILIKIGNDEKLHDKRKALSEILGKLGRSSGAECFAICNCLLCQKLEEQATGTAYRIPYQKIENLKERYVPKIQCYGSGKPRRIDEISTLDRPKIKVAIIHEPQNDDVFCRHVKEWFSKREIEARVWDKNDLLPGDDVEQQIRQEMNEADVLIVLISPHLINDSKTIDTMLEPSIKRANKDDALLLGLVVRETLSWQDCSPFNQLYSPIITLSDEPISSLKVNKVDKVWKTSGEKLHGEIDKWLDKTRRFKLKK